MNKKGGQSVLNFPNTKLLSVFSKTSSMRSTRGCIFAARTDTYLLNFSPGRLSPRTGKYQENFLKDIYIYGRTCLDVYITKKLRICPLLYVHIGDCSTTFDVFQCFHLNLQVEASQNMQKYDHKIFAFTQQSNSNFL